MLDYLLFKLTGCLIYVFCLYGILKATSLIIGFNLTIGAILRPFFGAILGSFGRKVNK